MCLNVNTCHLTVSQVPAPRHLHYSINGTNIASSSSYKYLGIHITDNVSWAIYSKHIVSEAKRTLGFLKQNLKLAPPHVKILAYNYLVRTKLEYASSLWNPHQAYLIKNIEAVHNRALTLIISEYSYETTVSSLKTRADLPYLFHRQKPFRLALFHKFHHHHLNPRGYITPPSRFSERTTHPLQVIAPHRELTPF